MMTQKPISLDKYLQEIRREPLLTSEDEVMLSEQIRHGNRHALERMVRANLRFVVTVANQYKNQGLPLPDLINEGNVGLIKAAQKFDATRGFKFISYAVWWIRESILHALAKERSHSSRHLLFSEREKLIIERTLGINCQPETSLDELCNSLGLKRDRIRQLREKVIRKLRSLEFQ